MKKFVFISLTIILIATNVMAFYEEINFEDDGIYVETTASVGVPNVNARSAILYDATYDRILYEKNSKQKRANASTTKMITALVAYERGNLEDVVEISKEAANVGGSTIDLKTGDKITLNDLIEGLLVHSGNDAAVAIAEYIAGDIESFSELMNEKAIEIGAVDTNFVTPHGLDRENHYSTAYDLVVIAKELLKNDYLARIVSQKSTTITVNGQTKTINSTNEMLSYYEGANGVKTGYTGEAGRCLITSANRNGRLLISVVLGCDSKKNRMLDSTRLLDYGFYEYEVVNLADFIKKDIFVIVDKSEGDIYRLSKETSMLFPLKESEKSQISVDYDIESSLVAPLKKGEVVGRVKIFLDQTEISAIEYVLPEDINRKSWQEYFYKILTDSLENYENMVEKMFSL